MKKLLKTFIEWPRTPGNYFVPWWKIAWRFLWIPLIYLGKVITYVGMLFAAGKEAADENFRIM